MIKTYAYKDMKIDEIFAREEEKSAVADVVVEIIADVRKNGDAALKAYGDKIAVGVDIKDGKVAIKGWKEVSALDCFDFCKTLSEKGVSCVICTDISKDGLLSGTNLELYSELSKRFPINFTASGGVTSVDDVQKLSEMGLYGAILGKALYTGAIDLKEAVAITKEVTA